MGANGALAGLVGITAPCAYVDPWAAVVIGLLAGVIMIAGVHFVKLVLKVDDPVGAITVHGICGAWGLLAGRHIRGGPQRRGGPDHGQRRADDPAGRRSAGRRRMGTRRRIHPLQGHRLDDRACGPTEEEETQVPRRSRTRQGGVPGDVAPLQYLSPVRRGRDTERGHGRRKFGPV